MIYLIFIVILNCVKVSEVLLKRYVFIQKDIHFKGITINMLLSMTHLVKVLMQMLIMYFLDAINAIFIINNLITDVSRMNPVKG